MFAGHEVGGGATWTTACYTPPAMGTQVEDPHPVRRAFATSLRSFLALGAAAALGCVAEASVLADEELAGDDDATGAGDSDDADTDDDARAAADPARQRGAPGAGRPCASPPVLAWAGTAQRASGYAGTDDVLVTVHWQLVESIGCLDHYQPSGTAGYRYALPGALCAQALAPDGAPITAHDGRLVVDRTTSPPTYHGEAATSWTVTWTCDDPGEPVSDTFSGGGRWLDAVGTIEDDRIAGEAARQVPDCHLNAFAGCTYAWSFAPAE
jgi:hypothetical protein